MQLLAIERLFKIAQYRNVSLHVADSITARKRRGSTAISWPSAVDALRTRHCRYPQTQFAGSADGSHNL